MSTETPLEFTKLSEVEVVDTLSSEDTVLIEQNSEIKRVTKDNIGAQSDWNETDETSLSFIKNKPVMCTPIHLYGSDNRLGYGYDEETSTFIDEITSLEEFYELYSTRPILIHTINPYGKLTGVVSHIIGYNSNTGELCFSDGEKIVFE